jgi:hypothetical protein
MTVKAHELPDLIAAAVKKVVDEKQLTDESLKAFGNRPLTIGIIFTPPETPAAAHLEAKIVPLPLHPIGFVIRNLDEIQDIKAIKPIDKASVK